MSLSQQKGVETRPNGTNPRKEAVDTLQRALHIAHELLDEKLTGRSLREFEIIGLQEGEMMRCSEIDIVDVCVCVLIILGLLLKPSVSMLFWREKCTLISPASVGCYRFVFLRRVSILY